MKRGVRAYHPAWSEPPKTSSTSTGKLRVSAPKVERAVKLAANVKVGTQERTRSYLSETVRIFKLCRGSPTLDLSAFIVMLVRGAKPSVKRHYGEESYLSREVH